MNGAVTHLQHAGTGHDLQCTVDPLSRHAEVHQLIGDCLAKVNADLATDNTLARSQIHRFLVLHKALDVDASITSAVELIVFGSLIIIFLIVEPHGLARLGQVTKERLRLWPFPH